MRLVLASLASLIVSIGVLMLMSERSEDLLASGDRVPGQVTGEWRERYGGGFVVDYAVDGERLEERVRARGEEPDQQAGDRVTVVVDPDDPTRIRTTEHANALRWWTPLPIMGVILGGAGLLLAAVVGVVDLRRRRRRGRPTPPAPPTAPGVSPRVARRVHRDLGAHAPAVLREMGQLTERPEMRSAATERLHAAVALASGGRIGGYADALRLARTDWRDLFVAADLADTDWPARLDRELGPVDA